MVDEQKKRKIHEDALSSKKVDEEKRLKQTKVRFVNEKGFDQDGVFDCQQLLKLSKEDQYKAMGFTDLPPSKWSDEKLFGEYLGGEPPRDKTTLNKLRTYLRQVEESDGYDVDGIPVVWGFLTSIRPIKCLKDDPFNYGQFGDAYFDLAKLAIDKYNEDNQETSFKVEKVEKVNKRGTNYHFYYMTFSAMDVKADQTATFRACVSVRMIRLEDRVKRVVSIVKMPN